MSARNTKAFTEAQVHRMVESALVLPDAHLLPDFDTQAPVGRGEGNRSRLASTLLEAFAPVLEEVDWNAGAPGMDPKYAKRWAETAKLMCAIDLANHFKGGGVAALKTEASTAGTDLPTFTRQLLMTVARAYPKLYTLQLFGVMPLQGPTGRLIFKDSLFDSAFNGSTPTIAVGDRQDDILKWNPDYLKAPEGQLANKLRTTRKFCDYSTADYRVLSEWSDSYEDDARSVYDANVDAEEAEQRSWNMQRLVDRLMLNSVVTNVPSGATIQFTARPANTPNYANLSPSEKAFYDEGVFRDGITKVQQQINIARKYGDDGQISWGICGTDFAQTITRLTMFVAFQSGDAIDMEAGPIRDLGTIKGTNIRFIVDPALSVNNTATNNQASSNVCFFGHRPMGRGGVGHYWMPYVNMQPTRDFYDPNIGQVTKGTRSRFAIAQPNTGSEPASSQLADIYGMLAVI